MATDAADRVVRIWCGPDDPPRGHQSRYRQRLNTLPPGENVFLKARNISESLAQSLSAVSLDLLEIAAYIYSADQSKPRGGATFPQDGRNWYRQFELSVPVRHPELWAEKKVIKKLTELLRFMANDDYRFVFRPLLDDYPRDAYFDFETGKPWFEPDSVLLFSGGLDSLTGVVEELQDPHRKLLLVSHRSVSKIDKPQRDLVADLKDRFSAQDRIFHIPVWVNKERGITKDANQRSRSFLYASLAAVIATMTKSREIKFYENGIVSSNLPVSDQVIDARASRSTHPKTLRLMSELFSEVLGHEFKVVNPFFGKTKSDVVGTLKSLGGEELIKISRSCTRTIASTRIHTHCGTCSQCIERRLAMLYNGLEDSDPEEMYKTRLFLDELSTKEERVMVESYIQHARRLEEIGIDDFYTAFPDGFALAREINKPVMEAGQLLYDLHHRHGVQAGEVIRDQIKIHADLIRKGQIPISSLLGMVVGKRGAEKRTAGPLKVFPTPDGATWEDIQIELVSRESLTVRVGRVTKQYHGFDMGFRDNRKTDRFTKQWELLEGFAQNHGTLNWQSVGSRGGVQKQVESLNKLLRTFFRLPDNPIAPYRRKIGWVAKFQVFDSSFGKS